MFASTVKLLPVLFSIRSVTTFVDAVTVAMSPVVPNTLPLSV